MNDMQETEKGQMDLLERITDPKELRKLKPGQLPKLAEQVRAFMVDSVSKTGGHLASSLGAVELAIALHYVFDTPNDAIVWDVGHQAYAHKILTGRQHRMGTLRQYGGLSGFPKREESVYDSFGTGHSSTSISAALGMAVADTLAGRDNWHTSVGALSGHLGRLVSLGPVWKAREASKALLKGMPKVWNLAKRMEKQTVNFLSPDSSIFSTFDLNYFGPIDGHNIYSLVKFLRSIRSMNGPVVLHVRTQKGRGYLPAQEDPTLYHGVSPFDPVKGIEEKPADPARPTYTQVFSDWICDMAEADSSLYAITPAMREGSGLVEFEKRFPKRYRDVAIAEQHAVTYAAGLACAGIHPVVAIYSTFAQRAYDQILHDVAIQNLPVTFAIDRGGVVGSDGSTHHGIFDISYLRAIPNMTVMTPSDENECRLLLSTAFRMKSPAAVRYPRGRGPGVPVEKTLETVPVGRSRTLRQSGAQQKRVAILAFGSMAWRLKSVAEQLDATLIDMRFVKPLDEEAVVQAAVQHDLLVTAEEGVAAGGAGAAVLELLSQRDVPARTLCIGIPDQVVPHGDLPHLFADLGMDEASVLARIRERL